MHFLFPAKFLTCQYYMNLAEHFVWIRRLTLPCCVFFTLVFHIVFNRAFSNPTFSEFPGYVQKETHSLTLRLNTVSVGQDPGLFLLFMSNFHWTETSSLTGRQKWGMFCQHHSNLSHWQIWALEWVAQNIPVPQAGHRCDPAAPSASLSAGTRRWSHPSPG